MVVQYSPHTRHALCRSVLTVLLVSVPGPQADTSGGGGGNDLFLMAMVWVVLGVLLYLFRPRTLRNGGDSKPARLVRTQCCYRRADSGRASLGR